MSEDISIISRTDQAQEESKRPESESFSLEDDPVTFTFNNSEYTPPYLKRTHKVFKQEETEVQLIFKTVSQRLNIASLHLQISRDEQSINPNRNISKASLSLNLALNAINACVAAYPNHPEVRQQWMSTAQYLNETNEVTLLQSIIKNRPNIKMT